MGSSWNQKGQLWPWEGMNEDWGSYVKTDAWNAVFNTMDWQLVLHRGGGAQPFLGYWSLTTFSYSLTSLSNPQLSHFPLYKPSLSFPLSASDDDSQSGYQKFRQNCCFLRTCTVTSIMRINTVLIVLLPVLAMTIRSLGINVSFFRLRQFVKVGSELHSHVAGVEILEKSRALSD